MGGQTGNSGTQGRDKNVNGNQTSSFMLLKCKFELNCHERGVFRKHQAMGTPLPLPLWISFLNLCRITLRQSELPKVWPLYTRCILSWRVIDAESGTF